MILCTCGSDHHLFCQYTEKLDLEELKSKELDSPLQRKVPATFTLRLKTGDVKLKVRCDEDLTDFCCYCCLSAPHKFFLKTKLCLTLQIENSNIGEEWRCYILTVVKVSSHEQH